MMSSKDFKKKYSFTNKFLFEWKRKNDYKKFDWFRN
jgi:hypothetical protein